MDKVDLLDKLCDELDSRGIEGNAIERDIFNGNPYVVIWPGKFEDRATVLTEELFFVYICADRYYEVLPSAKYRRYFGERFWSCRSEKRGYYIMTFLRLVDTIEYLFKKENNMNNSRTEVVDRMGRTKEILMKKYKNAPHFKVNSITYSTSDIEVNAVIHEYMTIKAEILPGAYFATEPTAELINAIQSIGTAPELPTIRAVDVIFNDPATIVKWSDGTKTVVKAENEEFDPEKGLAMAISKRVLGNKYDYYDVFKKYVGRYEKKQKKGKK